LVALAQLKGDLTKRVIVEPKNLKALKLSDARIQTHNVVEAQVKSNKLSKFKNFGEHGIHVELSQVEGFTCGSCDHSSLDFVMLRVGFISCEQFVRLEVSGYHLEFLTIQ